MRIGQGWTGGDTNRFIGRFPIVMKTPAQDSPGRRRSASLVPGC
jgi:hypothetical protein